MFCYQCEQTAKGEGCTKVGVCGKDADVAALQDLLVDALKGLSQVAVEGRKWSERKRGQCIYLESTLCNAHQCGF